MGLGFRLLGVATYIVYVLRTAHSILCLGFLQSVAAYTGRSGSETVGGSSLVFPIGAW